MASYHIVHFYFLWTAIKNIPEFQKKENDFDIAKRLNLTTILTQTFSATKVQRGVSNSQISHHALPVVVLLAK